MGNNKRLRTKSTIEPAVRTGPHGAGATISAVPTSAGADELEIKRRMEVLTDHYRFRDHFRQPKDLKLSLQALKSDLCEVPVVGGQGEVTDVYSKIEAETHLSRADKDLIWNCMAIVRDAFLRLEMPDQSTSGKIAKGATLACGGYQWNMNWKHTRAEIDQVLEASKLLQLEADELRDAILASIFSDAIKTRQNFIVHNIHGAQGAALALSYLMDLSDERNIKSIERITEAVKQHQITPPEFMARAVTILIGKKLHVKNANYLERGPDAKALNSIYKKISDPLNTDHLTEDLTRIDFTAQERELLKLIEIEDWFVPHPQNPNSKIADAIIAGDHSINYNHPEGFAKIALIRGPDTEAIFEDPTIHHSLDSAVSSFADSFRVIRPEVQPLAVAGLRRCKTAVERVTAIMRELFCGIVVGPTDLRASGILKIADAINRAHTRHADLFTVAPNQLSNAGRDYTDKAVARVAEILQNWLDNYGAIPFNPKSEHGMEPGGGKLPFWNAPLKYPPRDEQGQPNMAALTALEARQFAFAEKIREIAVELLRAEQWIY